VAPADTSVVIEYNQIMNLVTGNEICFYVEVNESSNPHGINGTARSNRVCLQVIENISVPNLFTPDGDLKNELFRPFLSFIPTSYSLVISDRRGRTLFETKDYTESWDGTFNGSRLPRDVFLWMLKVTTPSGRTISRTGTVTIFRNSD
jgi:gliding motility-associated-like protein